MYQHSSISLQFAKMHARQRALPQVMAARRKLHLHPTNRCSKIADVPYSSETVVRFSSNATGGKRAGPYGLKTVDYSIAPRKWHLPVPPPLQGAMGRTRLFLGPALCTLFVMGAVYVYWNQDDDIYDYWKQVERGSVPIDGEDDEDEEEGDEWDEEE